MSVEELPVRFNARAVELFEELVLEIELERRRPVTFAERAVLARVAWTKATAVSRPPFPSSPAPTRGLAPHGPELEPSEGILRAFVELARAIGRLLVVSVQVLVEGRRASS